MPISDNDEWDDGVNGSENEYDEEELSQVASSSGDDDDQHLEGIASMETKDVSEDEEPSDDCSA